MKPTRDRLELPASPLALLYAVCIPLMLSTQIACGDDLSDETIEPPLRWTLTWADEFDGAAGDLPDPDRWAFDVGGDGFGNQQLEHNTDLATNAAHDGIGNLVITAREEEFGENQFTSARILTRDLFEQENGLFEARIRLPIGQGIWPAFWMLGANYDEVGWPDAGEIDIMEYRGQDPSLIFASLHGPGYSGGNPITTSLRLEGDASFNDDFHVFAVEWDPGRITWSLDGQVFQIVTSSQVVGRGPWVFDHPFFLILNVAVGGTFVGDPDETTVFPQRMEVDYVRVYERNID